MIISVIDCLEGLVYEKTLSYVMSDIELCSLAYCITVNCFFHGSVFLKSSVMLWAFFQSMQMLDQTTITITVCNMLQFFVELWKFWKEYFHGNLMVNVYFTGLTVYFTNTISYTAILCFVSYTA